MRRNKYGARKTKADGITFHSAKEARRYNELKLLQKGNVISDLGIQPKFPVMINGITCFTYIADFSYVENGKIVIEDVKGQRTQIYRLKKKCVEAYYGIKILET